MTHRMYIMSIVCIEKVPCLTASGRTRKAVSP